MLAVGFAAGAFHPAFFLGNAPTLIDAMTSDELQAINSAGLACEHIALSGDGRHWYATVVSSAFEGQRLIQRHQRVYATLGGRLQSDEVHALSMKTYTPAEWAAQPRSAGA